MPSSFAPLATVALAIPFIWPTLAGAQETEAYCSLVVDGQEVWNSKCCVKAEALTFNMAAILTAKGWQACLYDRRHPTNNTLPTSQQKCYGPWINLTQLSDSSQNNDYDAYWNLEGGCHGGEMYTAKRTGNVYQGDKFIFEWRPVQ